MPRKKKTLRWEGRLGVWPHVVWYGERPDKGGVCYLRWWVHARENWRWQSCRTKARNECGELDAGAQANVLEQAKRQHDLLTGKVTESQLAKQQPITLSGTWTVLTDPDRGRFPTKTPYRDSLKTAIDDASKVLGADFAWMHFDDEAFMRVTRRKAQDIRAKGKGFAGFRGASELGTALITIMNVLRDAKRLPNGLAIPGGKRWRKDLLRYVTELAGGIEPEPKRPRHTIDEMRRILAAAPQVDPRFALLIALGAELRLGQVRRARRSNIDLEKGLFRSPGRGDKRGTIVELTKGQQAAVEYALTKGYLSRLEGALADYPLFPQGMLIKEKDGPSYAEPERHGAVDPVDKRTLNDWFRACEDAANVPHLAGRAAYGLRRVSVDGALAAGISPDELMQLGGWGSDRMPQTIYRDQQRDEARAGAARIRARIRGENVPDSYPGTPNDPKEQ